MPQAATSEPPMVSEAESILDDVRELLAMIPEMEATRKVFGKRLADTLEKMRVFNHQHAAHLPPGTVRLLEDIYGQVESYAGVIKRELRQ